MDTLLEIASVDGFRFENSSVSCCPGKKPVNGCEPRNPRVSTSVLHASYLQDSESQNPSSSDSSLSTGCESDIPVLKYINDMLMEEDLDQQSYIWQDNLALQAAEESFYRVLQDQSSLSDQTPSFSDHTYGELSSEFNGSPENGSPATILSAEPRRRYHRRDDDADLEDGRRNKQPAISLSDMEMTEKFEEVLLLCKGQRPQATTTPHLPVHQRQNKPGRAKGSSSRSKTRKTDPEPVDLSTLLMQCAQAVASFDQRRAAENLKQIRLHASQTGDGTQRLAFYFAQALEARLAGTIPLPVFSPLPCNRTSIADVLKAYKLFVLACPFKIISYHMANKTIKELSQRTARLHIIDFGILHGFQWPCLIEALSNQPGGPPMLRVTGIEFPQPGLRPTERVEETGQRLKRFCEKFKVPFQYNFLAKKWETITLDELEINRDETTVVNCLYRMRYIPDETISMNSPRDIVLKLIKDINPDLFVFGELSGMYNSPFFMTRFREALFHFSSLFDMFEATTKGEDEYRMLLEKELLVRDTINVIACEGPERVERPETFKQWQVRVLRAQFRQMELSKETVKEVKEMVRSDYHRDFVIDADNHWMFQGWKGRVIYALSFWKPVKQQQSIL